MTTTTSTLWLKRLAAGTVLAAAPALFALGTATTSYADTTHANNSTHHNHQAMPHKTSPGGHKDTSTSTESGGGLGAYISGHKDTSTSTESGDGSGAYLIGDKDTSTSTEKAMPHKTSPDGDKDTSTSAELEKSKLSDYLDLLSEDSHQEQEYMCVSSVCAEVTKDNAAGM